MVGKRETKTEVDSEYFKHLKQNNITLAKALTEERLTCKQYLEERIALQRKLDASLLLNFRYETIISKLLAESKRTVPVCTAILTNIQQILKLCSDGVNLPKLIDSEIKEKPTLPSNINSKRSSSPIVNKTHAVKPMVSGHVIFRPTINLLRLSDVDQAELTRNLESPSAELTETTSTSNDNVNNRPVNLAVQQLNPNLYDLDTTDPEILTETNDETDLEEPILNGRLEGLEPVEEEPEVEPELNRSEFRIREARVVIDPLSIIQTPSPTSKKRINTSINEDPLEGPSTLLDDSGQFTSPPSKYVSKPRAASTHFNLVNKKQRRIYDSDSDTSSDEEVKRKPIQNRNVSKRKLVIFKSKDEILNKKNDEEPKRPQNKKVKKNDPPLSPLINASICQPYVVLRREDLSLHENSSSSIDSKSSPSPKIDDQNVNDRPRRNKLKGSFKEMSLRCKLRREK